ncbi:trehalose-phosphatase [Arthrobacter sp.]|uniref:trehalose-phosphatase n=1 Tax=Arthrobacter sp. TaxID=1667 RepID=UPI003A8D0492
MAVDSGLRRAIDSLRDVRLLLVAMDFDGTMAPFVDRPADARALPASAEAFAELGDAENTVTALLSGRDLAGLRAAAQPGPTVLLVGSHGAERWAPDALVGTGDRGINLDDTQAALLTTVGSVLEEISAAHAGTTLEHKPAGVVLHVRQAEPAVGAAALRAARGRLEDLEGLTLGDGKNVLECSVIRADKGSGLEWLRDVVDADAVLFAGDDVTDEDAFAVLRPGDVGVKVGPGRTRAGFRVDGIGDVPDLLQSLLAVR